MFNGHLVLDEGIADVVSHFLINSLAELQYYLDELETMLAMDDSSKNLKTNRKYMLRCLDDLIRPLSILTSMARESPTCWSIIRCLSPAFEDRIAEAFELDLENVSSESDSVESLIEESATDFDYGYPGQPIHEKIWKWLESLTDWTYTLHQLCHPVGIVNSHLRRGFTIRLWIPELSHPIKQASLEDTLSFINWDPEDERSLEALQSAALAHRQRCISGAAPSSGPRDIYSVSQRILLGMEDRSRWSNAFEGSVHCQGLLACLIKERIVRPVELNSKTSQHP
ncbi:hypothetical protein FS837_011554 [Tulasnella sp. UAMH 9824]|nr:hypothetical protein FS837_011554 [Tulasnella sp. UAMH 9824]